MPNVRWPITAAAITERNTVNKETLISKKSFTYKKDLLTQNKVRKTNPRQITSANSHGK